MSRREIDGISGWSLVTPFMGQMPAEMLEIVEKCESPIEQLFVCALCLVILTADPEIRPKIDVQVPIGKYRADVVVIHPNGAPRIVIECDGAAFHKDIARDVRRTAVIEEYGYRVFRVTGSEIHHNPLARAQILLREVGLIPTKPKPMSPKEVNDFSILGAG